MCRSTGQANLYSNRNSATTGMRSGIPELENLVKKPSYGL